MDVEKIPFPVIFAFDPLDSCQRPCIGCIFFRQNQCQNTRMHTNASSFILGYPQTHSLWINPSVDCKTLHLPPFVAKRRSYARVIHIHDHFGDAKTGMHNAEYATI